MDKQIYIYKETTTTFMLASETTTAVTICICHS